MRMAIVTFLFATSVFAQMPALAPVPAGSQPINPSSGTTSFTFVVAGDNRPAQATCPQPLQLGDVVKGIAALKPAFVLWDGDIIYGKDPTKVAAQYPGFLSAVAVAGVPVFVAPGNHEMSLKGTVDCGKKGKPIDQPDPSGQLSAAFVKAVGAPYGMFRYGNSAFIALNTDDALDSDYQPTPCEYNGYVGKAQGAALKATLDALQADATVTNVFVFMHRPLKGEKSKDDLGPTSVKEIAKVYSLLQSPTYTKLWFVFASHEHLFYASGKDQTGPFKNDKRRFLVTGGAGAPLSKSGTGRYFHYLTVSVKGSKVTATIVPVNDTSNNCPN